MNSQNQKKHSMLKRAISIAIMSSICFTAALGVANLAQTFNVSDVTVADEYVEEDNKNISENADLENKEVKAVAEKEENKAVEASYVEVSEPMLNAFKVAVEEEVVSENSVMLTVKENDNKALAAVKQESDEDIRIQEWCKIDIDFRGKKISKDVPAGTVKDALAYLGIKLTEYDQMDVEEDQALENGMEITINRVVNLESEKIEKIDYKTINKDTTTLYEGETSVDTYGEEGERKIVYQTTWINGKFADKKEISNEVVKEPVDEVILNGTAVYVEEEEEEEEDEEEEEEEEDDDADYSNVSVDYDYNTITDQYGNVVEYTQCITGSSTAYTADYGALTATGRMARYGVVAVDPDIIPYGSILYIVSDDGFVYGYAVAGDTGGFIYNGTNTIVDLYFNTYDECCQYGRRGISVYVLSGVSEDATY